jgi:hypothetical protein
MTDIDNASLKHAIEMHGNHNKVAVRISLMGKDLDDVVAEGRVQFVNNYMEFYFEDRPNVYSKIFIDPTYLDLAVFVNDQIHEMEDYHHVFLENALKVEEKDGILIYAYDLGS